MSLSHRQMAAQIQIPDYLFQGGQRGRFTPHQPSRPLVTPQVHFALRSWVAGVTEVCASLPHPPITRLRHEGTVTHVPDALTRPNNLGVGEGATGGGGQVKASQTIVVLLHNVGECLGNGVELLLVEGRGDDGVYGDVAGHQLVEGGLVKAEGRAFLVERGCGGRGSSGGGSWGEGSGTRGGAVGGRWGPP